MDPSLSRESSDDLHLHDADAELLKELGSMVLTFDKPDVSEEIHGALDLDELGRSARQLPEFEYDEIEPTDLHRLFPEKSSSTQITWPPSLVPYPISLDEPVFADSSRILPLFCSCLKALAGLDDVYPSVSVDTAVIYLERVLGLKGKVESLKEMAHDSMMIKTAALDELLDQKRVVEAGEHFLDKENLYKDTLDREIWKSEEKVRIEALIDLLEEDLVEIASISKDPSSSLSSRAEQKKTSPKKPKRKKRERIKNFFSKSLKLKSKAKSNSTVSPDDIAAARTSLSSPRLSLQPEKCPGSDPFSLFQLLIWCVFQHENSDLYSSSDWRTVSASDSPVWNPEVAAGVYFDNRDPVAIPGEVWGIIRSFGRLYGIPLAYQQLIVLHAFVLHREVSGEYFCACLEMCEELHELMENPVGNSDIIVRRRNTGSDICCPSGWTLLAYQSVKVYSQVLLDWGLRCIRQYQLVFRTSLSIPKSGSEEGYAAYMAEMCLDMSFIASKLLPQPDIDFDNTLWMVMCKAINARYLELCIQSYRTLNPESELNEYWNRLLLVRNSVNCSDLFNIEHQQELRASLFINMNQLALMSKAVSSELELDVGLLHSACSSVLGEHFSFSTRIKEAYFNLIAVDACSMIKQAELLRNKQSKIFTEFAYRRLFPIDESELNPFGVREVIVPVVDSLLDPLSFKALQHFTDIATTCVPGIDLSSVYKPVIDRWFLEQDFAFVSLSLRAGHPDCPKTKLDAILSIDTFSSVEQSGCSTSLLDLFRFIYQLCEIMKETLPYQPKHVRQLMWVVGGCFTSYAGRLTEIVQGYLEKEEARPIWGIQKIINPKTNIVEHRIRVPTEIFVIINDLRFLKVQIKHLIVDFDIVGMYLGEDNDDVLSPSIEDELVCVSTLHFITRSLDLLERRIGNGMSHFWSKAFVSLGRSRPRARLYSADEVRGHLATTFTDMASKFEVMESTLRINSSTSDFKRDCHVLILEHALDAMSRDIEVTLIQSTTHVVYSRMQIERIVVAYDILEELYEDFGVDKYELNHRPSILRVKALLTLLSSDTTRLVKVFEDMNSRTCSTEKLRIETWPHISRVVLRKAIKARGKYFKDTIAKEFIRKYPSQGKLGRFTSTFTKKMKELTYQ